jgi:hypothetical protein
LSLSGDFHCPGSQIHLVNDINWLIGHEQMRKRAGLAKENPENDLHNGCMLPYVLARTKTSLFWLDGKLRQMTLSRFQKG